MRTRATILTLALAALPLLAHAQEEPVLPTVAIVSPQLVIDQTEAVQLPSSPVFRFASDYAVDGEEVSHYRMLLKKALLPNGVYADSRADFLNNLQFLVAFEDSAWSGWMGWPDGEPEATVIYPNLPQTEPDPWNPGQERTIFYLFAVQTMSADGAVSIQRLYGTTVANFRVTQDLTPSLAIRHPLLGVFTGAGPNQVSTFDLLGRIEGEFSWEAEADAYGGLITSYRWGWDIVDIDDPNDPGWAGPPGVGDPYQRSGPIPFEIGIHTLTVQATDNYDQLSRRVFILSFIPVPDPTEQWPLLLIDDVYDRNSNQWPDQSGLPRDRDEFRDAFWLDVLTGAGGVAGFHPEQDVIDTEAGEFAVRDIVAYRAVVWTARWVSYPNSMISRHFRPESIAGDIDVLKYVWLGSYQEQAGNVLLAGARGVNAFLPESPYVMPVIFASQEGGWGGWTTLDPGIVARVGFGETEQGDPVHETMYPYRNLGLAAIGIMSPNAAYYTPDGVLVRLRRRPACASLKGVALDAEFAATHMPGGAAFADTIWTEPVIDWRDQDPAFADDLAVPYTWSNDEFYDADILGRETAVEAQDCDGVACVEPLLRSVSRYDWNRQRHFAADPDDDWPREYYTVGEIDNLCGQLALDEEQTTALTNAQITAFVTHRFEDGKPSQVGDVVMGFDPYRFDHQQMKEALRWVLGEHFGLSMNP